MTNETIGNSIEDQILVQRHRRGSIRDTILRKTLISLAASAVPGIAAVAPNAAFAFPPGPPGLVVFLVLASVVLLTLAPVVFVALPLSVVPLVYVGGALFRVIFRAALQAPATAGLEAIATAVMGGETAPMASMSAAIMVLPLPIVMTAATTPTAPGNTGAFWFAPKIKRERKLTAPQFQPGCLARQRLTSQTRRFCRRYGHETNNPNSAGSGQPQPS